MKQLTYAGNRGTAIKKFLKHWQLYLVISPAIAYIIIFAYVPMYGVQIAFKDFHFSKGMLRSPWVGLKYFRYFFGSPNFSLLIKNTLSLSAYSIIAGFPFPILLAISLNEAGSRIYKKTVQMVTYAPYFISTVIFVSIVFQVLDMRDGILNTLIRLAGGRSVNFMGSPKWFSSIYVWSGIWQATGYTAIIYLAALSGIDPTLHEAAIVDGATKIQRILRIDLPGITPVIVIMLILQSGQIMNVGFEKVFLMQNPLNLRSSEVIATFVYKIGLISGNYSYSTAVGLFNSVINMFLLVIVNSIARRLGEHSLW